MTKDESSATAGVDQVDTLEETSLGEASANEHDEDVTDESPPRIRRFARVIPRFGPKTKATLLALLVVAAATGAGTVYWFQYRVDRQGSVFEAGSQAKTAAAKEAIAGASNGTVALLSYAPDSVDRDFAAAKSHLTGEFLSYYSKFTDQIVAPAAKDKGVKSTATVMQAAVSELHPDSAVVVLFINQTSTSRDRTQPNMTASSVIVHLTKVNGNWLISKFDPV